MLVGKIIPIDSESYKRWRNYFSPVGERIDSQGWIQLFSIWTLTVAGIVLSMDMEDRYVYWAWDGWIIGLVKLIVVSVIFIAILNPKKIWTVGTKRLDAKEILVHSAVGIILLLFGWIDLGMKN